MNFWSFITGTTPQDEQQAQLDATKQKFDDALARREAAGTIDSDAADSLRAYGNGLTLEDTDAAAAQGFKEGLNEGFQNVLAAPGRAIGAVGEGAGTVLGGILKNIPWWAYLLLLGAAVVYFAPVLFPLARRLIKR